MDTCFFCGAVDVNGSVNYECAHTSKVPSSQKQISIVLTHLANCIKANLNLKPDAKVCPRCFYELSEYDTIMVNLMTTQKKLTHQLNAALKFEFEALETEHADESLAVADEDTEKVVQDETEAMFVELVKDEDEEFVNIKEEYDDDDDDYVCEVEVGQHDKEDGEEDDDDDLEMEDDENAAGSEDKAFMRKRVKQECNTCGKMYNSKYQLQKHISEEHTKQQSFVCPICGIVRRDEEYLELHMNLHEGKTEKQCRYCPKSFSRPVNTLRHMRMHWDKKKYQCEKCGLRFSQDNLLYNHRLRHEAEENPIICSICNVSFKSRKTFNHHTLIHKENRPRHYCSVCPKSFTERYTLKMHMKTHEGDVVFGVREDAPADEQQVVEELHVDVDESEQAVTVIMSDNDESSGYCVICSVHFENKKVLEHHLQFEHDVVLK